MCVLTLWVQEMAKATVKGHPKRATGFATLPQSGLKIEYVLQQITLDSWLDKIAQELRHTQ